MLFVPPSQALAIQPLPAPLPALPFLPLPGFNPTLLSFVCISCLPTPCRPLQWLTGIAACPYDHCLYVAAYGTHTDSNDTSTSLAAPSDTQPSTHAPGRASADAPSQILRFSTGTLRWASPAFEQMHAGNSLTGAFDREHILCTVPSTDCDTPSLVTPEA